MSFFNNTPQAAPPADDYTFYNGNPASVDELFAELQEPKQPFTAPQPDTPIEPADDTDKPTTAADLKRAARVPAKFVVGALDGGLAYISALLAGSDESDSYKASRDEREQLTDIWAEYLKGKGADIPPSMMIIIMTIIVYAPKLKMAWDDREKNKLLREQRERLVAQEMELRELRAQVEQQKLKATLAAKEKKECEQPSK